MIKSGFDWTKGKPRSNGSNTVTFPKSYELIREDFGQDVADEYLALCRRHEGMLNTIVYFETPDATEYRKSLSWQ